MVGEIAAVCRRFGLELETVLPVGRPGPGVFLARVRGPAGEPLVLKRLSPHTAAHELAVLRTWSGTGITPRFVGEPGPGYCLVEWVGGTPLHEADDPRAAARAFGRTLRRLHGAAAAPTVCSETRHQFVAGRRDYGGLPPALQACRDRLGAEVLRRYPDEDVLLHGDVAPAQVLLTESGVRRVNPLGRRGLRAFEVAQAAVTCEGRGVRGLLPALVDGYGERPALLDEVAAYEVLAYLEKNLAAPGSAAVPRFMPMAETLLAGATPAEFVAEHLT